MTRSGRLAVDASPALADGGGGFEEKKEKNSPSAKKKTGEDALAASVMTGDLPA